MSQPAIDTFLQVKSPTNSLYEIIPEQTAVDLCIAPLFISDGRLVIAAIESYSPEGQRQLETSLSYPIQIVQANLLQIKRLHSHLYQGAKSKPTAAPIRAMIDALGFDGNGQIHQEIIAAEELNPQQITDWLNQNWISPHQWGEMLGWLSYLPFLESVEPSPLNTLLEFVSFSKTDLVLKQSLVPLFWVDSTLYLGVDSPARMNEIVRLAKDWEVQCAFILIPPAVKKSLRANAKHLMAVKHQKSDNAIIDRLLLKKLLTELEVQAVITLAKKTGTSIQDALIGLRPNLTEAWLDEAAQLHGSFAIHKHDLPENFTQILAHFDKQLPPGLSQFLHFLPLNITGDTLIVGLSDIHPAKLALLSHLTGFQIEPRLMDAGLIQAHLNDTSSCSIQQALSQFDVPQVTKLIFACNLLQPDQLKRAKLDSVNSMPAFFNQLLAHKLLEGEDIATIFSILYQTSHLSLETINTDSNLIRSFPQDFLIENLILPLIETDQNLWVGIADPYNNDALQAMAQHSNKEVWPVFVPESQLRRAINQTVHFSPVRTHTTHLNKSLDFLTRKRVIDSENKQQIIENIVTNGLPYDQAINPYLKDPKIDIYHLFAEYRDLPFVQLDETQETVEAVDPLGNPITQVQRHDLVEHQVARQLDKETAHRLGALPIQQVKDGILVAFADPLFDHILLELQNILQTRLYPCITSRKSLNAAIERVYGQTSIGTMLLSSGLITRSQLNDALNLSEKTHTRIGQALIHRGYISENQLYTFLAKQSQMPLFDLSHVVLNEEVAGLLTPEEIWDRGALPLSLNDDTLILGVIDPLNKEAIENIEKNTNLRVVLVLITENDFDAALEHLYQAHYTNQSVYALLSREPENSAARVLTNSQKFWLAFLTLLSIGAAIWNSQVFLITVNIIFTFFYILMIGYKFFLIANAIGTDLEVPVSDNDLLNLRDEDLPTYTILIPVYKEAAVLPKLLDAITKLDYPKIKLDVKVLLEQDDDETIQAFRRISPPEYIQGVIVPTSQPKTKPKACNYGLIRAKGEYVVIFDAEDRPEPDQLKRVLVAFSKSDENVICIQAKLNYFNRQQNLLTQWFSSEYAMWFDLFLPGLAARKAPIPLGGTSNHFKKYALVEAGAWDPHNMTEDADLGIRLHKLGYRTRIVDTTTYEEANSDIRNWIRQRSRWVKGYIQTWLVHMRHPIQLIKDIGFKAFFSFQMVVGGNIFTVLINPLYWLTTTIWLLFRFDYISTLFPGPIYFLSAFSLFVGNFAFTYINVAGAMGRGYYEMVRAALFSPLYWGLMSIGGWKGFFQLITKPHYWEKTIHGLDGSSDEVIQ